MNTTGWYIKNKVILFDVTDNLEIEDLKAINKEIITMLNETDDAVHIIYRSENVALPQDISDATHELTFLRHKNCGWVITIGSNILMTFAGRIINDISNIKLRAVANLDEVDKFISKAPQNHTVSVTV